MATDKPDESTSEPSDNADQALQYLAQRFPDMQLTPKPPSMVSVNGIGTSLYGSRDFDEETRSHVKTLCLVVLFIPVFFLSAYRVVNAPNGGGWYFIGKVPLSRRCRLWNLLLPLAIVLTIGAVLVVKYYNSESYKMGQKLRETDAMLAEGKLVEAAEQYSTLLSVNDPEIVRKARQGFENVMQQCPEDSRAVDLFRIALRLHESRQVSEPQSKGMSIARKIADSDPKTASQLVELLYPLSTDKEILQFRIQLLEKQLQEDRENTTLASSLAQIYSQLGDRARVEALLLPHENQLRGADGAALLGSLLADKGELDRAQKLLNNYVTVHLPKVRETTQELKNIIQQEETRIINMLRNGSAPRFNFTKYDQSNKEQQQRMVSEYIDSETSNNVRFRSAQWDLRQSYKVINAAMDLGIVQLRKGQQTNQPEVRKAAFEAAEATFLSIKPIASESERYQLSLGQVYHWMGRAAEAKKLFDEVLTASNRSPDALMELTGILRQIGNVPEARKLAEEAYEKATDPQMKHEAANMRAVMFVDIDDEILWLGRSNQEYPVVKSSLVMAQGRKAFQDGKDAEAIEFYQQSIAIQEKFKETSASLNNIALAMFELYGINRDPDLFRRAMDKMDRAVAMSSNNSILISNAAETIMENALRDIAGTELDFNLLRERGSWRAMSLLYTDEAGKQKLIEKVRNHPGIVKARGYFERLLLLAPNRVEVYSELSSYFMFVRDKEAMKSLLQKAKGVEFDFSENQKNLNDRLSGKDDARNIDSLKKAIALQEKTLTRARPKGGKTLAYVCTQLVYLKYGLIALQPEPALLDEIERLTEEAYKADRSSAVEHARLLVQLMRVSTVLEKTDPSFESYVRKTRRLIPNYSFLYAIHDSERLRSKALATPEMKKLVEQATQQYQKWLKSPGMISYVILKVAQTQDSAACIQAMRNDEIQAIDAELEYVTEKFNASHCLLHSLHLKLNNRDDAARDVLNEMKANGMDILLPKD